MTIEQMFKNYVHPDWHTKEMLFDFRADILSLMKSVVPTLKVEVSKDVRSDADEANMANGFCNGFGTCRSAILENINKLKGEK